jgi:hypothetical protein
MSSTILNLASVNYSNQVNQEYRYSVISKLYPNVISLFKA